MGKIKKNSVIIHDLRLIQNSELTEDAVVQHLKSRYESNLLYTRIGDGILIAIVNNQSEGFQEQESLKYVAEYKDTSGTRAALPPHIFQAVNQVYLHMRRTGIDQSILLRYLAILVVIIVIIGINFFFQVVTQEVENQK